MDVSLTQTRVLTVVAVAIRAITTGVIAITPGRPITAENTHLGFTVLVTAGASAAEDKQKIVGKAALKG